MIIHSEYGVFPWGLFRAEHDLAEAVSARITRRQDVSGQPTWRTGHLPPPPIITAPPTPRSDASGGSDEKDTSGYSDDGGAGASTIDAAPEVLLTTEQQLAVRLASREQLLLLTGGPGVGKTVTVRALVSAWRAQGLRVALTCPTARAGNGSNLAHEVWDLLTTLPSPDLSHSESNTSALPIPTAGVLSEVTGRSASTIHRLLEWSAVSKDFQRNSKRPLEADAIVVDEGTAITTAVDSKTVANLQLCGSAATDTS
jgi:nucleoside-triphosphatase THEP1